MVNIKKCLFVIFLLSLIDAVLTYTGIKAGYIEEANPLLAGIFHTAPELASLAVILFICAMLWIIGRYGNKIRWIYYGLAVLTAIKLYVIFMHFSWISALI